MNVLIGIWNILLYNHNKVDGKINEIIVFELELFMIKSLLLGLYLIILYLFNQTISSVSHENKNIESIPIIIDQ